MFPIRCGSRCKCFWVFGVLCCVFGGLCCLLIGDIPRSLPLRGVEQEVALPVRSRSQIPYPDDLRSNVTNPYQIRTWIQEYQSLGDDFAKRNEFAFHCALYHDLWFLRMSVLAFDPSTTEESQSVIAHLASAMYTKTRGSSRVCECLDDEDAWIVAGQLKILRSARELKPDGSNRVWPDVGPLGPIELPKHIAAVLKRHPELAIDICQTLEVYGPLALKESETLLPLLLSDDVATVKAALTAIHRMDPNGLCQVFKLDGVSLPTSVQQEWLREYIDQPPAIDNRESDGTMQTELSKQFEVLRRYFRLGRNGRRGIYSIAFQANQELALHFRDQNLAGDWWRTLVAAYGSPDFRSQLDRELIRLFAAAIYTKPGGQADALKLLQDDDPRMVERAMSLISELRPITKSRNYVSEGELFDSDVMPAQFVKVLNRHPHLFIPVAVNIGAYGDRAANQADALVPYLLSDDVYVVTAMRAIITSLNPGFAEKLGVAEYKFRPIDEHFWNMEALTVGQREKIEVYLKSRKQ